jgi:hypothetical protein
MFMHFIAYRWTNIFVGFDFLRFGKTVSRYFHVVLDAICVLSGDLIATRSTKTHPKISLIF